MTNERYLPERIIINGGSRPNQGALKKLAGVKVYKYMSRNDYLPNIISGELYFSKSAGFEKLGGHDVNSGVILSITVTVCTQVVTLPELSLIVHVTVVVPTG